MDVDSVVQNNSELSYFEKVWIGVFCRYYGFIILIKIGVLIMLISNDIDKVLWFLMKNCV